MHEGSFRFIDRDGTFVVELNGQDITGQVVRFSFYSRDDPGPASHTVELILRVKNVELDTDNVRPLKL